MVILPRVLCGFQRVLRREGVRYGAMVQSNRRGAFRALALAGAFGALTVGGACRPTTGAADPCTRTHGTWVGHGVLMQDDAGRDPDAVRIASEVVRAERWRITGVTPLAMQRERAGLAGGRVVGEAMYLRRNGDGRCEVELATAIGPRAVVLTPRADGTLVVRTQGGWYDAVYRRP